MGSGASMSSRDELDRSPNPRSLAIQRRQMMEMVENFVASVYATCPRVDAMWLILSSKLGQKAFEGFLRADFTDDFLDLFLLLSHILVSKSTRIQDLKNKMEEVKIRLEKPIINGAIPELFRNEFFFGDEILVANEEEEYDETAETEKSRLMKLLERLQGDVVMIMARDYFNDFLLSKNYKNWRAAESSHATATTVEDAAASSHNNLPILSAMSGEISFRGSISLAVNKSPSTKTRYKMKKILNPGDLSTSAFSGLFSSAKEEVLGSRDSWLQALLAAVEALPISFSLAIAKDKTQGFPLIYVNKCFERMTGFSRRDILGMSAKEFLHCPETEPAKSEALAKGLSGMTMSVSVISNRNKEGRVFKNLVALKPITTSSRRSFAYVIGLHYDVTNESPTAVNDKVALAEELLEMLPNSIITDDDHFEVPSPWRE
jgi:PAS domain S-box-containing protein